MKSNPHVVVIDDSVEDLRRASQALHDFGVVNPTVFTDVKKAIVYLECVVDGDKPCPDLVLLDLDFGVDSGFEVLRLYKTHPRLHECKIVVWTVLGKTHQDLCKLFGIENVISKDQDQKNLKDALSRAIKPFIDVTGPQ
jgi:CheY-like chemotaxis protein